MFAEMFFAFAGKQHPDISPVQVCAPTMLHTSLLGCAGAFLSLLAPLHSQRLPLVEKSCLHAV
ncbi:hypothetical protein ASF36_01440 [Methylobacterium sp. Leaf90]|nr:hypothetical protein ASF36_01440 [Methylobacterium sp. Leaf90]